MNRSGRVLSFTAVVFLATLIPVSGFAAPVPSCEGKAATIVGTSGDDTLIGTNGDDVIVGLEGNDQIEGGAGHDILCGSQGDDTLIGGTGNDTLRGGYGSDWASYGKAPGAVIVDLVAKTVTGHGTDSISSVENILGSPYSDKIYANNVDNILRGSGGQDFIRGRGGNDTIHGGPAYDLIYGGEGNDLLFTDCGGRFRGPRPVRLCLGRKRQRHLGSRRGADHHVRRARRRHLGGRLRPR